MLELTPEQILQATIGYLKVSSPSGIFYIVSKNGNYLRCHSCKEETVKSLRCLINEDGDDQGEPTLIFDYFVATNNKRKLKFSTYLHRIEKLIGVPRSKTIFAESDYIGNPNFKRFEN